VVIIEAQMHCSSRSDLALISWNYTVTDVRR